MSCCIMFALVPKDKSKLISNQAKIDFSETASKPESLLAFKSTSAQDVGLAYPQLQCAKFSSLPMKISETLVKITLRSADLL